MSESSKHKYNNVKLPAIKEHFRNITSNSVVCQQNCLAMEKRNEKGNPTW